MFPKHEEVIFHGDWDLAPDEVVRAAERLKGHIHRMPLVRSSTLARLAGCEVLVKQENLQKTGAFKIRGALNKIASLSDDRRRRGIVTASAGNHAQGVALAARAYGVACTVVMPVGASPAKVMATRSYGAQVVLRGETYDDACAEAVRLSRMTGAAFVHAFDDPYVIAGQGTLGLELLEDAPDVRTIVVPVGGGGLLAGVALAVKTRRPDIRVVGVQPEGANSDYLSWVSGRPVRVERPATIADGLAVKSPGRTPLSLIRRYADGIVTVSDEAIAGAILFMLERMKMLVEGAGAAPLAAILSGRLGRDALAGPVALVASGGNVSLAVLAELAARYGDPGTFRDSDLRTGAIFQYNGEAAGKPLTP